MCALELPTTLQTPAGVLFTGSRPAAQFPESLSYARGQAVLNNSAA